MFPVSVYKPKSLSLYKVKRSKGDQIALKKFFFIRRVFGKYRNIGY